MPCGHNFCKACLDRRYAEAEAAKGGGSKALAEAQPARSLRVRKVRFINIGRVGASWVLGVLGAGRGAARAQPARAQGAICAGRVGGVGCWGIGQSAVALRQSKPGRK
jgi:hypothetical protein